jgi:transcriptional regulator with XRE-family HTH domain
MSRNVKRFGGLRSALRNRRYAESGWIVENWQAVADAVNARMIELPISQRELAEKSAVSVATIRELQHATAERKRSTRTLGAISEALGWPEDYLRAVLKGDTPPSGGASSRPAGDLGVVLSRLDQIHGEVRRLAEAVDRLGGGEKTL